jgi:predicted ATP-grasp superfamily ATP-dependent carboligase
MASILITDGEQRAALAVVRSLGRAGHRVIVTANEPRSLAGSSRFAAARETVPDPLAEPGSYARRIAELVARWKVEVLLPITDASLMAILAAPGGWNGIALPFADLVRARQASDKALLTSLAPTVGIAVPEQLKLGSPAERATLDVERLKFPIVLKPSRSVATDSAGRQFKLGVLHAAAPEELERALDRIPEAGYPVLLQQRIVGPGVGIFLLVWKGETIAVFSHRRIREKPPAGGVSVYRESIAADPALVARSRALLDLLQWEGVAMIEYKLDGNDGTPYLMEINGRFWGSLQLAIDAGVDFPALLVDLALGKKVVTTTRYRTGVRSRWWWGDVDHLLARLRRSDARLALPPGAPGRFATLARFAVLWRPGDRNEIFRWNDPRPFFRETLQWLRGR